jgi:DNA-binding transcriptional MocR family regulator
MSFLYETLADELAEQIQQGTLPAGERLPGVRLFSQQRGVSPATAVSVYRRLEADGLVESRPRSGFFVRNRPNVEIAEPGISRPSVRPRAITGQQLSMQLVKAANEPDVVQLGTAVPNIDLLPSRAIERSFAKVLRQHRRAAMGYTFPPGLPELRKQIARRMADAGCRVKPDEIVITNGCQEAVVLALRAVTSPGDIVAVESPTFYGLLQAIDSLGLKALEIPTHPRDGLSLDALQLALEQWPVKACIAVPNFSNPLGYCMPDDHKKRLVKLLQQYKVPLVEDDIYGDLGFAARRPPACKAFDRDGNVLYCASFSKTLSPGLRVGWIAPGGAYFERVEHQKYVANFAGATAPQMAIAELLHTGAYERHVRKARSEYARTVERMTEAVGRHFPEGTKITRPQGGFVIWVELDRKVDTFALSQQLLDKRISIAPGPIFSATQKYKNFLRLSCAYDCDKRIEQALATIARTAQAMVEQA